MNGTVTISLEDFTSLLEASKKASSAQEKTKLATKELQVFLTFLCDREDISKYVDEFNLSPDLLIINSVNTLSDSD